MVKFQEFLNIVGKFMDIISNVLSNICNGIRIKLRYVRCPKSNLTIEILKLLQKESIILGFVLEKRNIKVFLNLKINNLKIKRISKNSNRVYVNIKKLPLLNQGAGISILSTSKGLMSDFQARSANLGGELICQLIWN